MAAPLHVVVLPWSAFGHMIPFLHLSIALAKSGVHVSYVTTPRNIQRLPRIPPSLSELLEYEELPMQRVEELPQDVEATVDASTFDQIQYLKLAYDLLEQPFSRVVANRSPDWIIADFAPSWAVNVAKNHGVPLMFFSVFTAATLFFAKSKAKIDGEGQTRAPDFESCSTALRPYETPAAHAGIYKRNASEKTDAERMAKVLQGCQAVAIRSCNEFEGEYIDLFKGLIKKPVVLAGLLPPPKQDETGYEILDESWSEAFKWLDEQGSKSVVFVGFGSECKLTKEQVNEIAYGLELSRLPFLLSLRKPSALPQGFGGSEIGRVCIGWAPQLRILSHPAIGGCLFHSGWGSIIESLQHGHRLVVLPFVADHGLNARLLVDKELAVEVERRPEDGWFSRDDVARALRRAMVEEEGEKLWARARSVARVFGDAELHQECYIGGLVEYMRNATTLIRSIFNMTRPSKS